MQCNLELFDRNQLQLDSLNILSLQLVAMYLKHDDKYFLAIAYVR